MSIYWVFSNVIRLSINVPYLVRKIALEIGTPIESPALTVKVFAL